VDCRERSTPSGEASLNQLPHASPGLLPLGHYCFNKPASAYLQAGTKGPCLGLGPLACKASTNASRENYNYTRLSEPLADFPLSPDILQNDRKLPVVLTGP